MSNTSLSAELNSAYTVFEPSMLLTSQHLNQQRNYLDVENRLTRVKLIGTGIVCGLEIEFNGTTIKISEGIGVTSEGFLVRIEAEEFDYCFEEDYFDPAGYEPFLDASNPITGQYHMWELMTNDQAQAIIDDPDQEIKQEAIKFDDPSFSGFLKDKVVVLFVEYLDVDLESCVGDNCDDKGIERRFTVRKLLMNCADVHKMIQNGYKIPYQGAANGTLDASLNMRFYAEDHTMPAHTIIPTNTPADNIRSEYAKIVNSQDIYDQYESLFPGNASNPMTRLSKKIVDAYGYFGPILNGVVPPSAVNSMENNFKTQYASFIGNSHIQYYYDYGKDITEGYNSFIDLAFEITSECNIDDTRFPRHLVLGKVTSGVGCPENEDNCKPQVYRTHFIQASIYNQQKDKIREAQMRFVRLVEMVEGFIKSLDGSEALRITPSDEKQAPLDRRSIPFYYKTDPLYKSWSYKLARRCIQHQTLGYGSHKLKPKLEWVSNPLKYNKDPYNFYRIEGVLGKNVRAVCKELEEQKKLFNLDFEIMPVKLRPRSLNQILASKKMPNDHCEHEDCCGDHIKDEYLQLRNEIIAEVEKYNWILTKLIYIIGNFYEVYDKMLSGEKDKAEYATGVPTDATVDDPAAAFIKYFKSIDEVDNLINALPKCIEEFNPKAFQKAYKDIQEMAFIITVLFERLLRIHVALGPFMQYMVERYLLANYGYLGSIYDLNDILRSHFDVQLLSIWTSYTRRLEVEERSKLFSNFAFHNPGLEHMAGVPRGGVFVMVYGDDLREQEIIGDFALTGRPCCGTSVDFCGENLEAYPPIAKNVYYFIEENAEPGTTVLIDVLEFSLDINVEKIGLHEFPDRTRSEKGANIGRVKNPVFGHDVVEYTVPNGFDKGIDTFDYTIENTSGKVAKGCVFVAKLPMGTNYLMSILKGYDSKSETHSQPEETVTPPPPSEEVKEPTWKLKIRDFEMAEAHEKLIEGNDTGAKELIESTRERFKILEEAEPLKENATVRERKKLDDTVHKAFAPAMEDTAKRIDSLKRRIPKYPKFNTKKGLMDRLEMADTYDELASAKALYNTQLNALTAIAVEEKLTEREDSKVARLIKGDVRKQILKLSESDPKLRERVAILAKKEDLDPNTLNVFSAFKIDNH